MSSLTAVVRELDLELVRRQAQTAEPFPNVIIDNFLDPEFAREISDAWPSYEDAAKAGKTFRSVNERKKIQVTDSERFPMPMQKLNDALASAEFVDGVSKIFDIPDLLADAELVGGGLHQTGSRGRLDVHVDFNYIEARQLHRRLNILIYFNENWLSEWGGQLELWNRDVSRCVHTIEPIFNRCVIFETSEISFHGVKEVTCPKDELRRSFAAYYYTKAAPAHWTGESHSTIFKARPQESMKDRLMAVESAFNRAKGRAKGTVKRVIRHSSVR